MKAALQQASYRNSLMVVGGLSLLGWAFVFWSATNMDAPLVKLMMPMKSIWSPVEALLVWVMWAVMMGAMMLPSAAPMILAHRRVVAQKGAPADNRWFTLSYLLVWSGFSVVAAALQWGLQSMDVLSHMLVLKSQWMGAVIMITTGAIQWTPLKNICLQKCRTPIGFLTTEWRPGGRGALAMGLKHGIYCVGCCWALMALLFVFGVMNLIAIVGLATLVAFEKLVPGGDKYGRYGGWVFISWGGWILLS